MKISIALFAFTYIIVTVTGCEPDQYHNGCMIQGNTCKCGFGCKTDYIYKTRRACRNALKVQERTPNTGYGGAGYGSAGNGGASYGSAGNGGASYGSTGNGGAGYGNAGNSGAGYGSSDYGSASNGGAGYGSSRYGSSGYGGASNSAAGYGGAGYGANYGASYSAGYGANFERTLGLTQPIAMTPSPSRSSDICSNMPCSRGICIQTANEPGFACKCEGTGFYGQRCEKACPTMPMRGMVFPHECVVI